MQLSGELIMTRVRRLRWVLAAVGLLFSVTAGWVFEWPAPVQEIDSEQTRINRSLPAIQGNLVVEQILVPQQHGFHEVELILINYRPEDETVMPSGRLTITVLNTQNRQIAQKSFWDSAIEHNQTIRLAFPPEQQSANQRYTLRLEGDENNQLAVWGYTLNPFSETSLQLQNLDNSAQTLYYKLRYQLLWPTVPNLLWESFGRYMGMMLLMLLLIFGPGLVISEMVQRPEWNLLTYCGVALVSGLSFWPLMWLWMTVIGGRFYGWLLWLIVIGSWAWWVWQRRNNNRMRWQNSPFETILFVGLLLVTLSLRLLAVRDLAFLPWVDASRHALITVVMSESGQFLRSYEPYLPIENPLYHFGFHTVSAGFVLLSGRFWPLETVLLGMMQFLSSLMPLAVYAGVQIFSRQRAAAWLAAFLVAVPFFFPAYYTTWGRLTQLSGGLIMAILIAVTWRSLDLDDKERPLWPLVALLAAGLFLIHFRVFTFYVPFAVLVFLLGLLSGRFLPLVAAGGVAIIAVSPQLLNLLRPNLRPVLPGGEAFIYNSNPFPTGYVTTGWELYFWIAAGVGVTALVALLLIGQKEVTPALLLATWIGLLFLLTAGDLIGWLVLLPQVNLNSMYIALFAPKAMVLGLAGTALWVNVTKQHWILLVMGYVGAGALVCVLFLFGVRYQLTLLNDVTFLARSADQGALEWIENNTPPEAKFAVSAWRWFPHVWASNDGSGWIMPLTGRRTTTPPIDYAFEQTLLTQAQLFNDRASEVEDWSTPEAADLLRQHAVTHVYVGQREGFLDPAELSNNEALMLLYAQDGVYIFALKE